MSVAVTIVTDVEFSPTFTFAVGAPPSDVIVGGVLTSLSVMLTVPVPVVVTDALLVTEASVAERLSGPSMNASSVAVTVRLTVFPLVAPAPNVWVFEEKSAFDDKAIPVIGVPNVPEFGVPLAVNVSVTNNEPVGPPSVAFAVPDKVIVAVSLSPIDPLAEFCVPIVFPVPPETPVIVKIAVSEPSMDVSLTGARVTAAEALVAGIVIVSDVPLAAETLPPLSV